METERKLTLVEEPPVAVIEGLSKTFGSIRALRNISLELPQGRIIGLLGPNGSVNTTIIKILAGLYVQYEGQVRILGEKPSHKTKALVSYAPDRNCFPAQMTCRQASDLYKTFFEDFNEDTWEHLLDCFSLSPQAQIRQMSKGMIDKLQICLAMSRNARLYLLDEPLAGVDAGARDVVLEQILESFNPKGTILIATHLIAEIERLFDTVIFLSHGELVEFGECDCIRQRHGISLEDLVKELS